MSKLREYGARAWRISRVARCEFTAFILGLIILPLLHIAIKLRLLNVSLFARCMAAFAKGGLDIKDCREDNNYCRQQASQVAQALFIGVRLWGLGETSCVARSLLLWMICMRRDYPVRVWVGVARNDVRKFHTWVEVCDQVIDDSADVAERYQRFEEPLLDTKCRVRNVSY